MHFLYNQNDFLLIQQTDMWIENPRYSQNTEINLNYDFFLLFQTYRYTRVELFALTLFQATVFD